MAGIEIIARDLVRFEIDEGRLLKALQGPPRLCIYPRRQRAWKLLQALQELPSRRCRRFKRFHVFTPGGNAPASPHPHPLPTKSP